jgi:predicted acetyltransferase
MIIRLLTPDDIVEHDKITSQAFSYSCDIYAGDSVLPCEKVLGAFDDDNKTLFADLEIHERLCNYDGGFLTCAAVGGVAAKPEHRGKGAVKALFDYLFKESAYDVSVLYPFSEAYYRKLGYESVGRSVCATVPFSELSEIKRNQDVTLYEGNDTERLLELYNRCARNYNLSFVRETAEAFSSEPYFSKSYTYIWKNDSFATIRIDRENSTVFVKELYFDSCESMLGILGFLRNFESNQKSVCFEKIPEDSPLLNFVQDLKNCDVRVHNTGSARILNFEKVLKARQYPRDGEFALQIGDDVYKVTQSKNGVEIDQNSGSFPDVIMNMNTASKILLSGIADGAYMPQLVIKNPESDFFKLFPPKTSFFTDAL